MVQLKTRAVAIGHQKGLILIFIVVSLEMLDD